MGDTPGANARRPATQKNDGRPDGLEQTAESSRGVQTMLQAAFDEEEPEGVVAHVVHRWHERQPLELQREKSFLQLEVAQSNGQLWRRQQLVASEVLFS